MTIIDPEHKIDFEQLEWIPLLLMKTMKACLRYEMKSRPSTNELIQDFENADR